MQRLWLPDIDGITDVMQKIHDDVMIWKHFPRNWPFVRGIHQWPVNSCTKASDAEAWFLFYLFLNKRLSNQSGGHGAHYEVIVMHGEW